MTEHEHFDKEDFRVRTAARSYEDCLFTGCLFSSADLRDCEFTDCRFERCDLSMALLENTSMRTVRFHECKLLGTSFENCNQILFAPDFERCLLDYASFRRAKLRKRLFCGCSLRQADFSAADLSGAVFADCDLDGATFDRTVLEKTDFSTARNYSIDPETNRIRRARFSIGGLPGLLGRYDIDISET